MDEQRNFSDQATVAQGGEPAPREADGGGLEATFARGDLLAERYRVERFIARGGAGEVYEVEDQALGARVALKTVYPRGGSQRLAVGRFKREIQLARQVTHPNVCRIYEFGQHRRDGEEILFLTMELLPGTTLFERIHSRGPMPLEDALPLVRQMATGLEAAHQAGVVHRDFKSGNVMLVPAPEAPGGTRVVITDFGLARAASHEEQESTHLTAQNVIVGTPAYMAPEQVEGTAVSPATDVYALGVVLYEMVTGQYPFEGESGLSAALRRLSEPPSSPRIHRPDIDPRWEQVILRCLERQPADRYASAPAAAAALEAALAPPSHRRTAVGLAAAAALAVGLAAGLWWWSRASDPPPVASAAQVGAGTVAPAVLQRPALAVLGFRNLSPAGRAAWLDTALTEMLAMEAAAGDRLRVVPGETVERTRQELGLGEAPGLPREDLARLAELLGSTLVATGSYLAAESGDLRLDLQVLDTTTGEVVARVSDRGSESGVLDLVESVGRALRAQLGAAALSRTEAAAARASLPADAEAARLYAEGLEQLRLHDARAGLELLRLADERDPDNPLVHIALADAWDELGYGRRAEAEAERAHRLLSGVGNRERLFVEARYYELSGDRDQAVERYRLLWDYFPDTLEYGLRLAGAQIGVGDVTAAEATIATLRARSPAGVLPQIALMEAEAARARADYRRQQEAAARAAREAEELSAELLLARAREVEAGALRDLGKPDESLAAYRAAEEIYEATGHRGAVARVLVAIAKLLRHQGRLEEAMELNAEALRVAQAIGDQGSIKHALNTAAIIHRQQGRLDEALEMHRLELATNREIGDERGEQITLTSLGVAQLARGDLDAARDSFTRALELGRSAGNKRSISINLNLLGEVHMRQGRLAEARRAIQEALDHNRDTEDPRGRAYYVSALAEADRLAGDLTTARRRHQEALELRRSIDERTNIAFSQMALARLDLAAGRPADALERLAESVAEYRAEGADDAAAVALGLRARAEMASGQAEAAAASLREAESLVGGSQDVEATLRVAIDAGRVALAAGRAEAAGERLRDAARRAAAHGYVDLELEAALLAAHAADATGDPDAARQLAAASDRARQLGLDGIVAATGPRSA